MGYDANRFVDLPSLIEDELCCNICCGIFQKPVITHCGHTFCKECLITWFDYEKTCPICRKIVTKICKPPIIITNILSRLKIKCNFNDRGCTTIVSLDGIEKHEISCSHRTKPNFFKNLLKNVFPNLTTMLNPLSSLIRTTNDYDVEVESDEDDEVHLIDANMDNHGQVFPYFLQAVTVAGIVYNCYNLLNGV